MKRTALILLTLIIVFLSACGSNSNNQTGDSQDAGSIGEITFDLGSPEANECIASLSLDFLDLDAIENQDSPTEFIQDTFPANQTYCAEEITQKTQDILNEFDSLMDAGSTDQALQLVGAYVNTLDGELLGSGELPHLAAPALSHDGGRTRRYMKQMFTIAARLQLEGFDDEAQDYIDKATDAFEKYGYEELALITDDFKAALAIAAEAQLLGLNALGDDAIDKAMEIVEKFLNEALDAFEPCSSTQADVDTVNLYFVYGQLLGVEAASDRTYEFYDDKLPEWKKVQKKRKNNEQVEGCDLNAIKIDQDIGGFITYSGEAYSCDGTNWTIEVSISGNFEGIAITGEGETTEFIVTDGKGETTIPTNGSVTKDGKTAVFQVPLVFGITLSEDGQTAEFGIGSNTPNGIITVKDTSIIFALPGGFFTVPMTTHACDN